MVASPHGPQRGYFYFPIGSEIDLDQSSFDRAAETDEWSETLTYKERYSNSIGEARLLVGEATSGGVRSGAKGGEVGLGALGEIRTPDPRIRSPMLYPAELRARLCCRRNVSTAPITRVGLTPLPRVGSPEACGCPPRFRLSESPCASRSQRHRPGTARSGQRTAEGP